MSWRPVDCHAHSTLSDGALDLADFVVHARARGVVPSVADHVTRDIGQGIKSISEMERYLQQVEKHEVLPSGEFCWHDTLWRELPPEMVRRLSHRVGSLHGIFLANGRLVHMFGRWSPGDMTPAAYMDAHLANLERFATEMPADILAHPTLLPTAFRRRPLEELWTEEYEERAVAALRAAGIAFEINNRYRPHERFIRRAIAGGVRLSLGSDGHAPEQVADVLWPLATARALGVRDEDLYDPRAHGSRTGFHDQPSERVAWGW